LDCLGGDIANSMVQERRALLAKGFQDGQDRVNMATHQAGRCPYAHPLGQKLNDLDCLIIVNSQFI
jgi:hypothetical protein